MSSEGYFIPCSLYCYTILFSAIYYILCTISNPHDCAETPVIYITIPYRIIPRPPGWQRIIGGSVVPLSHMPGSYWPPSPPVATPHRPAAPGRFLLRRLLLVLPASRSIIIFSSSSFLLLLLLFFLFLTSYHSPLFCTFCFYFILFIFSSSLSEELIFLVLTSTHYIQHTTGFPPPSSVSSRMRQVISSSRCLEFFR